MRAYFFIGTGLLCFASMGIVHKLGDRTRGQPLGIALFATLTASLISFLYAVLFQNAVVFSIPGRVVLLAIPFGISAALAIWMFQVGLRYGHIATSWLLINLSAGVPAVLSILFYREGLTWKRVGVLGLVILSLLLLWWDRRKVAQ